MLINGKIKAAEVQLIDNNGDDLGIVSTSEALALAKKLKVDLVCTSLMSSPPECRLISVGDARQQSQQAQKKERTPKLKEIRLNLQIEEHDYETKKQQAERILTSGDSVLLVVRVQGKEGPKAKDLIESMLKELQAVGRKQTGVQVSGKQAYVQINPLN